MRSLRGRLTLGILVVLAGVLAVAAVLIARDVDRDERRALDDRLQRTAELSKATAVAAVNDVRSERSLKGLLPGETRTDEIASGGSSPKLTIACDRLVPGQAIEYDANLEGSAR